MPKLPADPEWGHNYRTNTLELGYPLTTVNITEDIEARSNVCYWKGTIDHTDVTAAALTEDIKIISNFPAKYKILEIMVDSTEKWDDGAGPISAVTLSCGWTGANYDDLIQTQDIYTATVLLGDAAGEINYTAVQGGIRASWSANTDIYLRFVAVGGNLDTLATGNLSVYITYQVYE